MNLKSLLVPALLMLIPGHAFADRIPAEKAKEIAGKFQTTAGKRKAAGDNRLQLAHASEGYYAFNRSGGAGFILVASDDNASMEVLGYSDSGTFDPAQMPCGMQWLLGEYDKEAKILERQTGRRRAPGKDTREEIAPMVTSKWNQNYPYNMMCPTYKGERCVTGCVATALAQIMNYHEWPERGTGSHSYTWLIGSTEVGTLSRNFEESVYQWDNMLDSYTKPCSTQKKEAVARLMADIGVGVEMSYSPQSSGAADRHVTRALRENFGYDNGTTLLDRDVFSNKEWNDILHKELSENRPIYYSGASNNAAHAFLLDGYKDGMYHVNWGWGGMSDGYFALTALGPESQGIGGGSGQYNSYQNAIIGIKKAEPGSSFRTVFANTADFKATDNSATTSSTTGFKGVFKNLSEVEINVRPGIKITDTQGNVTYIEHYQDETISKDHYIDYIIVKLAKFPDADGTYRITPAYKDCKTGEWSDILTQQDAGKRWVTATKSGETITFANAEELPYSMKIKEIKGKPVAYTGYEYIVDAVIENNGEDYVGLVMAVIGNCWSNSAGVALSDGDCATISNSVYISEIPGTYTVEFKDVFGHEIPCEKEFTVEVKPAPTGEFKAEFARPLTDDNATEQPWDNISLKTAISCTSGIFVGEIYAVTLTPDGKQLPYMTSMMTTLVEGDTEEMTFNLITDESLVGQDICVSAYYFDDSYLRPFDNLSTHGMLPVRVTTSTGIDTTTADSDGTTEVFDTMGRKVTTLEKGATPQDKLKPGLYIMRNGGKTSKRIIR